MSIDDREIDFERLFGRSGRAAPPRRGRAGALRLGCGPLVAAGILAVVGIDALSSLLVEWWWFGARNLASVYVTRLAWPLGVFAAATAAGAAILAASWLVAARGAGRRFAGQPGLPTGRRLDALLVAAAAGVAALIALGPASRWDVVALYRARGLFGIAEPIFGRDAAFYVFDLAFYRWLLALVLAWLVAAAAGTAAVYAVTGAMELGRGRIAVPGRARVHLATLGALACLALAAAWWLARYGLLHTAQPGAVYSGPGYADIVVRMPALAAMSLLAVAAAVLLVAGALSRRAWSVPAAAALVAGGWLVLGVAVPVLVHQLWVTPNELSRERPYIAHNIELTRAAWGLSHVTEQSYRPTGAPTAAQWVSGRPTLDNARLWDWSVLIDTLQQTQQFRTYYHFVDVDLDRYPVGGTQRQVNVAVRELDLGGLRNPTWVNEHLEFTHGFGSVMAPVNESLNGQPVMWLRDIPPTTHAPFTVTLQQPRVYFGESFGDGYSVVGTRTPEFDYPSGDENVGNSYDGAEGVPLGGVLRRLAFALRFGDLELLISDAITPSSRVLWHRDVEDRIHRIAPFLVLDPDPYAVVTPDGRLVWMVDAYTATSDFPYGRRLPFTSELTRVLAGQNYARNSVKAVVDAYDGTTTLYVVDPDDAIVATWSRIFPGLLRPAAEMPDYLRAHWRYPEALFRAQAEIYLRYHMTTPEVFYSAEDLWAVPSETRAQGESVRTEPYYTTLRLRGETEHEMVLMLPLVPVNRPVMVAWLAGRSDPGHYGELIAYRFGKGEQVDGPQIVENRIDNDTRISEQLTLWSQAGSNTVRGNLLVYPIDDALVYVEPLFLKAEAGGFPELKQVIVATADRVVMRETMDEALAAISGGALGSADAAAEPAAGPLTPATTGDRSPAVDADVAETVSAARAAEAAARRAAASGDWEAFGRAMAELQDALDRLGPPRGAATAAPTRAP